MFLIDSHCHIDLLKNNQTIKDIKSLLFFCKSNNVGYILTVSTSIKNFLCILNLVKKFNNIGLSCGIHPLYCNNFFKNIKHLKFFSCNKKVIAIGETGLDFFKIFDKKKQKIQKYNFFYHLYLSYKKKKPIIIHSRNSFIDTLNLIKIFKNIRGVVHCYSYNSFYCLSKFLDLGLYISFSGLVTFNNNKSLQDIVKYVPLDRLLIETDSPFLSPEPYRGKINNPSRIIFIAKKIAKIKNIDLFDFININMSNFIKLFKIKI